MGEIDSLQASFAQLLSFCVHIVRMDSEQPQEEVSECRQGNAVEC